MKLVLASSLAVLLSSSLLLACAHESTGAPVTTESAPVVHVPIAEVTGAGGDAPAPLPAVAAEPSSASCLEVDSSFRGTPATLEGEIFVDDVHEHPTRGKTHPYILRLDAPRCVLAAGHDEPRVTEVHLAATDGVSLRALVGKHVRVSGEPFAAHTAWHARGIVVLTSRAGVTPRT